MNLKYILIILLVIIILYMLFNKNEKYGQTSYSMNTFPNNKLYDIKPFSQLTSSMSFYNQKQEEEKESSCSSKCSL
jgi:hypothetical protein